MTTRSTTPTARSARGRREPGQDRQQAARPIRGLCCSPAARSSRSSREDCGCGPAPPAPCSDRDGRTSRSPRCGTPPPGWRATSPTPAKGFPDRSARGCPAPTAFYATLLLLAALAGLLAAAAIRLWERHRTGSGVRSKDHGARWAHAGDLVRLRHTRRRRREASRGGAETGSGHAELGLSLGYQGMRLLRAEERHALVVFGPTQSGKSAGIAIPNILEWQGPAIVVSIKPDLLDATITTRSQRGEVLVFDPFALWDQPGHTWSPLASARTWNGALGDRAADGLGRRDRHQRREGRELLVPGRRAAPRPAAVRRRPHRPRDGRRRAVGVRAGRRRARPPHAPAHRPEPRRERARGRAARVRRARRVHAARRRDPRVDRGHRADPALRLPLADRRALRRRQPDHRPAPARWRQHGVPDLRLAPLEAAAADPDRAAHRAPRRGI